MGTVNSIDVKIAVFFKRCFNYYIKKRTYSPPQPPPPSQDETWESLFIDSERKLYSLDNEIKIILYKDSKYCKLIYFGFEETEIEFLKKYLKKGDTFIDIGANIGLYSLYASKIVDNKGKVIAFEPTPSTFKRLMQNIQLNNVTNVEANNIGLSNQKSTLKLHISNDGYDAWNSFTVLNDIVISDEIDAYVDTLDSYFASNNIKNVRLVKVDVEGWEKYVLEGATNLLKREDAPVFLIEFTETNAFAAGYYIGEIFDFMKNYGYDWYSFNSEQNLFINEKKKMHYPYENLIAIKNLNECLKRISE
jgi:FkbM family methyltransferase